MSNNADEEDDSETAENDSYAKNDAVLGFEHYKKYFKEILGFKVCISFVLVIIAERFKDLWAETIYIQWT